MSVCFSTRSSLRRERERRERKEEKCLSFLKKNTLFLSLSFSSALSLSLICFGCRFVFFPSLLHFFSLGEIKCWSSLSFSLVFGEIGKHIRLSFSLFLSLLRARFGKPDLPFEYSAAHAERGIIFEKEEINSSGRLARESRKKKMDWISSHCGTNRSHTEESRQRRKRI